MYDFFKTGVETHLASVVVVLIFIAVIAVLLWRRKRLSQLVGTDSVSDLAPVSYTRPPAPVQSSAEREVSDLINEAYFHRRARDWAAADRVSSRALSRAIATLPGDDCLLALTLNARAVYLIDRGFFVEARRHLEPAVAIIDEWSGSKAHDKNIGLLKTNLKLCQDQLGF